MGKWEKEKSRQWAVGKLKPVGGWRFQPETSRQLPVGRSNAKPGTRNSEPEKSETTPVAVAQREGSHARRRGAARIF